MQPDATFWWTKNFIKFLYFNQIYSLDTFGLLLNFQNFLKTDQNNLYGGFYRFLENCEILIKRLKVSKLYIFRK